MEPLACLFSNMIIFDDDLQEAAASWARLDQETKQWINIFKNDIV